MLSDSVVKELLRLYLADGTLGEVQISHHGIVEMEATVLNPDRSTEHFVSVVIQHFHGSVHGGVQGGGTNNTQTVSIERSENEIK